MPYSQRKKRDAKISYGRPRQQKQNVLYFPDQTRTKVIKLDTVVDDQIWLVIAQESIRRILMHPTVNERHLVILACGYDHV